MQSGVFVSEFGICAWELGEETLVGERVGGVREAIFGKKGGVFCTLREC